MFFLYCGEACAVRISRRPGSFVLESSIACSAASSVTGFHSCFATAMGLDYTIKGGLIKILWHSNRFSMAYIN